MTAERIGVFGGTFDPPHLGHIYVARSAALQFELSRVLWIPAFQSPHKTELVGTSVSHRLQMTRFCVAEDQRFELSMIELDRGGVSYTVETLEELSRSNTDARLFLIVGADSFSSFSLWKQPVRITELAGIVVYPRSGTTYENAERANDSRAGYGARWLDMDEIEISSTDIRSRIKEGRSVSDFVPDSVQEYIINNGLYQNK